MRNTIKIDGKTYRVGTIDTGNGPNVSVEISTGPRGAIASYYWRSVPRNGPIWNKVMCAYKGEKNAS